MHSVAGQPIRQCSQPWATGSASSSGGSSNSSSSTTSRQHSGASRLALTSSRSNTSSSYASCGSNSRGQLPRHLPTKHAATCNRTSSSSTDAVYLQQQEQQWQRYKQQGQHMAQQQAWQLQTMPNAAQPLSRSALLRSGLLAWATLGLTHMLNGSNSASAATAEAELTFEQRQQLLQQQDQQQQPEGQQYTTAEQSTDEQSADFQRLLERITTQGDVWQPWPPAPWAPRMLYYPPWIFGQQHVDSFYDAFRAPLGERFVSQDLLQAARAPAEQGGVGSRLSYDVHYFSTLPDTLSNQIRVNFFGALPESTIIPDRAFNTTALTNAVMGYPAVASVFYDPRESPDKETVVFAREGPGGRKLAPKRCELYINKVQSALGTDAQGRPLFITSELCRQVTLGVRSADVADYEVMNAHTLVAPGKVSVQQRVAVYLDPMQPLYFEAARRAVALYDWRLEMAREAAPADAPRGAVACVMTPKDVAQCV